MKLFRVLILLIYEEVSVCFLGHSLYTKFFVNSHGRFMHFCVIHPLAPSHCNLQLALTLNDKEISEDIIALVLADISVSAKEILDSILWV